MAPTRDPHPDPSTATRIKPASPHSHSPALTSWLKAFTASMLAAAADAGGRPRGGGKVGDGRRRSSSSVLLNGCARTWPFGGGGARALRSPLTPSLARSVRSLTSRPPAQTVSPSGMAEPTPRRAPWDRAGLPAPRHPQATEGKGGVENREEGREGERAVRRGHHVTRGRVTPRAPPYQRWLRPGEGKWRRLGGW